MKITFIIGGARSGKSLFALTRASEIEGQKAYIATAEALDDEMRERIGKHKAERSDEWDTLEEPLKLSPLINTLQGRYRVVLLDCLTIWLSNILLKFEAAGTDNELPEDSISEFTSFLGGLKHADDFDLFMVSNEVGTGIVPENKLARTFRDLSGALNQKIAELSDEVYLVTAGIPLKIKG